MWHFSLCFHSFLLFLILKLFKFQQAQDFLSYCILLNLSWQWGCAYNEMTSEKLCFSNSNFFFFYINVNLCIWVGCYTNLVLFPKRKVYGLSIVLQRKGRRGTFLLCNCFWRLSHTMSLSWPQNVL